MVVGRNGLSTAAGGCNHLRKDTFNEVGLVVLVEPVDVEHGEGGGGAWIATWGGQIEDSSMVKFLESQCITLGLILNMMASTYISDISKLGHKYPIWQLEGVAVSAAEGEVDLLGGDDEVPADGGEVDLDGG